MSKKKRKNKRRPKIFPFLEDLPMAIAPEKIVTDAGWDKIRFPEVCKFFTPEEIRDCYISLGADVSELLSDEDVDLYLEDEEEMEEFLNNYDWAREEVKDKQVRVVVAKAIHENNQWVRLLTISTPDMEESYFHNHEIEAIYLGIHLRRFLNLDIPVVNDSQDAVRFVSRQYKNVGWQPRSYVTKAHKLKISQANKIYSPTTWDEEWDWFYDADLSDLAHQFF